MSNIKICGIDAEVFCKSLEEYIDRYKNEKDLYKSAKGLDAISDFFCILGVEADLYVTKNSESKENG